jgi:hypothetical protein
MPHREAHSSKGKEDRCGLGRVDAPNCTMVHRLANLKSEILCDVWRTDEIDADRKCPMTAIDIYTRLSGTPSHFSQVYVYVFYVRCTVRTSTYTIFQDPAHIIFDGEWGYKISQPTTIV